MPPDTLTAADVSVVICTYSDDRRPLLEAAIRALDRQTERPAEVIIVVDHNPGLLDTLVGARAGHTIVANNGPPGLSSARNCGLRLVTTPIVAFLDDDAAPAPDWVMRLAVAYAADVLGVGGLIIPQWTRGRPGWFPDEFDWVVGCTYRGGRIDGGPVRNMLGANMSFRTAELRAVGAFRHGIGRVGADPMGCEETEACIRMGARWPERHIRFEPTAVVRHHVPSDRGTWRYFVRRCWAEGVSKARVAGLAGGVQALSVERSYVLRALSRAVAHAVAEGIRTARPAALGRGIAVVVGLVATALGFVVSRLAR